MYSSNDLFMSARVNVIVSAKQSGGENIFHPAKYELRDNFKATQRIWLLYYIK